MTEPVTTAVALPTQVATDPISDSSLRRLFPKDGLFLRSKHLDQISDYAEQFALAAGVAAGPGVDHGLTVTVDEVTLTISRGLAVDASRRPLRLAREAEIRLDKLDPAATQLWIVEIEAAPPKPEGREPVFGALCDDPAGNGAIAPWRDAAVRIRVRPLEFTATPESQERNKLASAYFKAERIQGKPWLPPPREPGLIKRPWREGRPADPPASGAVPIATLLRDGSKWVVDTWIARRDIGGPPARAVWEGHLGLRPWNVFIAQVLQFQAHLADFLKATPPAPGGASESVQKSVDVLAECLPKKGAAAAKKDCIEAFEHLKAVVSSTRGGADSPFVELPPAGVIPLPEGVDPAQYFWLLFNTDVPVEVERPRADCALRALEDAQHLDRIDLATPGIDTYVRLLVPPAGNGEDWMVFVRGCCPADRVDVLVYVAVGEDDFPDDPDLPGELVTTLQYPRGAWALPGPEDAMKPILEKIDKRRIGAVRGCASADDRRSLAFLRSALIVFDLAEPDRGVVDHGDPDQRVIPSVVATERNRDAIVISIEPSNQ
jgi:hypothetical protein